jgi:hypothetical protein
MIYFLNFKDLCRFTQKRITVCVVTNRNLFSPNRAPKMPEKQQLFFGLRLVGWNIPKHPAIQTKVEMKGLKSDGVGSALRTSTKLIFLSFFCLLFFEGTFLSLFKDKKS